MNPDGIKKPDNPLMERFRIAKNPAILAKSTPHTDWPVTVCAH
jgi:hypothetical protein